MSRVSDIIETDTVIAGNVLRVVNSALYGRRGTVNSVRHAVSLLGINKLRNTAFAMSITRVWRALRAGEGWSMRQFNLHSVSCAVLCDCLAQRLSVTYPEGAFAAGLFHDLGALLVAVGLPEEFEEIRRVMQDDGASIEEAERQVIGMTHAELSAEALSAWNLPAVIQSATRFHEHPDDAQEANSGVFGLALVIKCANEWLNANRMALLTEEEFSPEDGFEPFAALGVSLGDADFLDEVHRELASLSGSFQG